MQFKNKILLIEDNPNDIALTERALRDCGASYDLEIIDDGLRFLHRLQTLRDWRDPAYQPDLVLLDLKLPKVSGIDILRRIRASEDIGTVPVIIMSTSIERRDVDAGYAAGANSFVRKPVDFEAFKEAIFLIARYWLRHNTLAKTPKEEVAHAIE